MKGYGSIEVGKLKADHDSQATNDPLEREIKVYYKDYRVGDLGSGGFLYNKITIYYMENMVKDLNTGEDYWGYIISFFDSNEPKGVDKMGFVKLYNGVFNKKQIEGIIGKIVMKNVIDINGLISKAYEGLF